MPRVIEYTGGRGRVVPVLDPLQALVRPVRLPAGDHKAGTVLGEITSTTTAANEVQTLTIAGATSGTFRLEFFGAHTAAIAFDADAAAVRAALEALPTVGPGNVGVTGAGPFSVEFKNALGNLDQRLMTVVNSTNGTVTVAADTEGHPGGKAHRPYSDANADGSDVARAILQYDVTVLPTGLAVLGGGEHQEKTLLVPAYFCGTFKTRDLTGLDAAAVADLGRLISGGTAALAEDGTILCIG